MHNLLLTGAFHYTSEFQKKLFALNFHIYYLQHEAENLPLPASDIDAVVCNSLFLHHDIDEFANLKFIQLTSAGLDRVPIDKIQARNIELHNARGVYNIPMAEWTVFRVLEYFKRADHFNNAQQNAIWAKNRDLREISDIHVAIIGAGNVGQTIAKLFFAFGANVVGFDIHQNAIPYFAEMDLIENISERIGDFDVVVITAPLTSQTYHLISDDLVANMKQNALLVNIARGALIDESALCRILQQRKDIHAALDVFEIEPLPADSPLWKLPNVYVSPHNSFVSDGNSKRMFEVIYNNLRNFAQTQR